MRTSAVTSAPSPLAASDTARITASTSSTFVPQMNCICPLSRLPTSVRASTRISTCTTQLASVPSILPIRMWLRRVGVVSMRGSVPLRCSSSIEIALFIAVNIMKKIACAEPNSTSGLNVT